MFHSSPFFNFEELSQINEESKEVEDGKKVKQIKKTLFFKDNLVPTISINKLSNNAGEKRLTVYCVERAL